MLFQVDLLFKKAFASHNTDLLLQGSCLTDRCDGSWSTRLPLDQTAAQMLASGKARPCPMFY